MLEADADQSVPWAKVSTTRYKWWTIIPLNLFLGVWKIMTVVSSENSPDTGTVANFAHGL